MTPRFSSGAKMAERAPMAILASPERRRHHSSNLSPADNPLCIMAAREPKRRLSWESIWGVSDISGTKNIEDLPSAS